jgi:hypothetical protein
MKPHVVLVIWLLGLSVCLADDKPKQEKKRIWGRSHIGEALGDGKDTRLEGLDLTQGPEHLVGVFDLTRQREGTQLKIEGHLSKAGEFIPNVSLAVADRVDGNWIVVESSLSDRVDVTLTAAPHLQILFPRVQLDAFQPYVGKFKFCRVVLQTGESEVFPMVWLTEKGE